MRGKAVFLVAVEAPGLAKLCRLFRNFVWNAGLAPNCLAILGSKKLPNSPNTQDT